MRPLIVLAALLKATVSLAQAAPAPAPDAPKHVLLVWGGGKTAAEGEAAAKDYRERALDWEKVLQLPKGYPRVMESSRVPGLKPGFHVAVLGVCKPEEGASLTAIIDALEPRAYGREVTWSEPGPLPCPQLAEFWSFHGSALAKGKKGDLLVAGFRYQEQMGDSEVRSWHLVLSAFDKRGKVLDSKMEFTGADFAEIERLEARGNKVVMQERQVNPACHGSPIFQVQRRTWRFHLDGQQVAVDSDERVVEEGDCHYPELGPEGG